MRALKREAKSPFMFVSERGAPFSVAGLAKLVERTGIEAKLPFKAHPHSMRQALPWRTRGQIRGRSRRTWDIAAFN